MLAATMNPMNANRNANPLRLFVVATLLFVAAPARAQDQPSAQPNPPGRTPASDPSLTDPSLDDAALARERRDLTDEVVAPAVARKGPSALPSVPGLSSIDYRLPNRKFLPEGTLITGLVGTLVRSPMDDVIFLPDATTADAGGTTLTQTNAPAMVLLPTQKLAQLTAATRGLDADTRIAVSGQAYVYRDRQFLLPTTFAVRPRATAPAPVVAPAPTKAVPIAATPPVPAAPTADRSTTTAAPTAASPTDPRVDDLIRDLEAMRGPARVMDPTDSAPTDPNGPLALNPLPTRPETPGNPLEASEGGQALTPEGTLIVNRRGRLTRSAATGGRIAMAFDNDPDSPGQGTMVVLPCALLRSMEEVVATKGDDTAFNVSGRVLVYEGQNYLLPVLFQARQTLDIRPQQ